MIYNNEVIYNEKWNTPENKAYQLQLLKYFEYSQCSSHCPISWAREVLDLVKYVDKKYGIRRPINYQRGFVVKADIWECLIATPLKHAFSYINIIRNNRGKDPDKIIFWHQSIIEEGMFKAVCFVPKNYFSALYDGIGLYIRGTAARLYNFIYKPKCTISQIKEKYGTLRISIESDCEFIDKDIEEQSLILEIKLAQKGAYGTLDSLSKSYYETENEYIQTYTKTDDEGVVRNYVRHYEFAELMNKRLGIKTKVDPIQ